MKRINFDGRLSILTGLLVAFLVTPAGSRAQDYYTETFESLAGWSLNGNGVLNHQSTGGNPGGMLELMFSVPSNPEFLTGAFTAGSGSHPAFTGDIWSRDGGNGTVMFSFDFRADDAIPAIVSMAFVGNGEEWGYVFTDDLTVGAWANLLAPLAYEDGVWNPSNPLNNTGAAFVDSLSNVTEFKIYVDAFVESPVTFSLDNVSTVVPEPFSLALILTGLAGLRLARRRA